MNKQKLAGFIMVPVVIFAIFVAWRSYRSTLAPDLSLSAGPQRASGGPGGAPGGAPGGGGQQRGPTPAQMLDEMAKELALSPTQKTQISVIQDELAAKRKALPQDMSRETRRTQMTANRAAADVKIKALLSADQQTKYDALQAKRRAQMQAMRSGGGSGGGMPGSGGPIGGSGGRRGGSGGGMPGSGGPRGGSSGGMPGP